MRILDVDSYWWRGHKKEIIDHVAESIHNIEDEEKRYKEIRYLVHSLYHESGDSRRFTGWTLVQDYDVKKEDIIKEKE